MLVPPARLCRGARTASRSNSDEFLRATGFRRRQSCGAGPAPAAGARDVIAHRLPPFDVADVRVDPARRTVSGPQGTFQLEPRVMAVLVLLAQRAPEPVSRDELIDEVWAGAVVTDGVLTRCVSILRERLGDERGSSRFIETLSKHGYRLVPPVSLCDPARGTAAPAPADAAATIPIAVLPFANLAGGLADDHVVDGLTELLITNLAGVAALRVIARTSSMTYRHTGKRLREIAGELEVDYVVEGSVLGDGRRLQVVVQLIDARTEMHTWAQTYVRELRDMLTLINEIARAVAKAVSARLRPAEAGRLDRRIAIGEPALQHYLKGRYHWAQRGAEPLRRAHEEFAACVREAPAFAPAHVGLADCCILIAIYGIEAPLSAAARARVHVDQALALDPDGAEVQTALGAIRLFFDWDLAGAERAFQRALAVNPSYTTAYLSYGDLLMMRGECERGIAMIRAAVKLSPFDLGLNMNLGDFLLFGRRFEDAVRQLGHTADMDERFVPGRLRLAEALALAGRADAACEQVERAAALAPAQPRIRETRAFVLAATGRHDEARQELAALASARATRYVSAWEIARAYAVMGDADAAIRWLRESVAERAPMTLFAGVHAALDPVRDDPRFPEILHAVGFTPARG